MNMLFDTWFKMECHIKILHKNLLGNARGISGRSVRRYCRQRGLTRINDLELVEIVQELVGRYGHTYGRRLLQGSIREKLRVSQCAISQRRVSRALQSAFPQQHQARARDLIDRTNPIPSTLLIVLFTVPPTW